MAKQENNRIPRSARTLQIEFLINTFGAKKGEIVTIHKGECGWTGETASGKRLCFLVAMLRNPEVCKILSAT